MGIFAIEIEHPLDMTVQRLHDRDRSISVDTSISASIAVAIPANRIPFFGGLVM